MTACSRVGGTKGRRGRRRRGRRAATTASGRRGARGFGNGSDVKGRLGLEGAARTQGRSAAKGSLGPQDGRAACRRRCRLLISVKIDECSAYGVIARYTVVISGARDTATERCSLANLRSQICGESQRTVPLFARSDHSRRRSLAWGFARHSDVRDINRKPKRRAEGSQRGFEEYQSAGFHFV